MVERAKVRAGALIDALLLFAAAGVPIVGLEPSCLLTLRDETLVIGFGTKAVTVADANVVADGTSWRRQIAAGAARGVHVALLRDRHLSAAAPPLER